MRPTIADDAGLRCVTTPGEIFPSERTGYQERPITRHRGAGHSEGHDLVAEEMPLALVVNGISHVVMMVTPRDFEEFAVGFALTEGLVDARAQIYDAEVRLHPRAVEVELTIAQEAFQRLKGRRRALAGLLQCAIQH